MTWRITSLLLSGAEVPPPLGAGSCEKANRGVAAKRPNRKRVCALRDKTNVSEPQFNSEDRDRLDSLPRCRVVSVSVRRPETGKLMIKGSLSPSPLCVL